jgi:hypothetical protein
MVRAAPPAGGPGSRADRRRVSALCGSPRLRDGAYGELVQRRAASWESALFGPSSYLRATASEQVLHDRDLRLRQESLRPAVPSGATRATSRHEARAEDDEPRRAKSIHPCTKLVVRGLLNAWNAITAHRS